VTARMIGAVTAALHDRKGSLILAWVVTGAWVAVLIATQVVASPALDTGWTVFAGIAITVPLILGYPSALRGPRSRRREPGGRPVDDGRGGAAIAAMGRPLPYLRQGLTAEAAARTARALRPLVGGGRCAVAITDLSTVLGWAGPGARRHGAGHDVPEPAVAATLGTRTHVLAAGPPAVAGGPGTCSLGACDAGCPLGEAVVVPLVVRERAVGCLVVVARRGEPAPDPTQVTGVAGLLALHLEMAELDREAQLAADARLDALRAQINPHFLFNTLNTIASKARTDPDAARQLLLRLADFFRYSIRQDGQLAEFAQEYFFVRTYLALEQARFGDRLKVRYDIDPQVLGVQVPVLVIQPLVENAVRHGLTSTGEGGTVTLRARVDPLVRATAISVHDDGTGMSPDTLKRVVRGEAHNGTGGGGIGLANISQRLDNLFADQYSLDVRSRPGAGTTVDLRVPLR
jgi:LytS/YehU family sensor histidine kinase